eukprot:EG_transcript_52492
MPSKSKQQPKLAMQSQRILQTASFPGEPDSPLETVERVPSGMILTSSRSANLGRQRSMSANGPLFTPVSSISNWADEMDRHDAKSGGLRQPSLPMNWGLRGQPPQPPPQTAPPASNQTPSP